VLSFLALAFFFSAWLVPGGRPRFMRGRSAICGKSGRAFDH